METLGGVRAGVGEDGQGWGEWRHWVESGLGWVETLGGVRAAGVGGVRPGVGDTGWSQGWGGWRHWVGGVRAGVGGDTG